MAVSSEIVRSWRNPRRAIRRQLASGVGEGRALAYLMAACALIFVAQWPRLAREAHLAPEVPLEARLAGAFQGWVLIAPLFFYALAALSHVLARGFGGRGGWLAARLALFWTLLAVAPLFLLHGLAAGFVGPGAGVTAIGVILAAGFVLHWALAWAEAEELGGRGARA